MSDRQRQDAWLYRACFFAIIAMLVLAITNQGCGQTANSDRTIRMKVTAYCLCEKCCGPWAAPSLSRGGRKTSIGDDATIFDGVAADPKLLPYRTRLRIPGVGVREVDDTGGAMRKSAKKGVYHVDVRMDSHAAARRFGVKWLKVEVLPKKRKE